MILGINVLTAVCIRRVQRPNFAVIESSFVNIFFFSFFLLVRGCYKKNKIPLGFCTVNAQACFCLQELT